MTKLAETSSPQAPTAHADVDTITAFMSSIGFHVTYKAAQRVAEFNYTMPPSYRIHLNETDGNQNLSTITVCPPWENELIATISRPPWMIDLHEDFYAILPDTFHPLTQANEVLAFLTAFANLLTGEGYTTSCMAATIAIWYNCRWGMSRQLFQDADNARHILQRCAALANYTNLTLTQRVECARRDIPLDLLDMTRTHHIPYTLIAEMHPPVTQRSLFELPFGVAESSPENSDMVTK